MTTFTDELKQLFADTVRPPEQMTVSEWADRYRVLGNQHAEPGPFVSRRVPYLPGYQDLLGDPNVDELVVMKCSQAGVSEGARNALGYWVANDPGDTLWVFPDERSVKKTLKRHIIPMAEQALADYMTGSAHDVSEDKGIQFRSMILAPAWSGSPQALASDPYRRIVLDEVDKYPAFSGREADPVSLAKARARTYGMRALIVQISTPTTRDGPIARAFYSCSDRRHFWVPCQSCGEHQILTWSQVVWPTRPDDEDRADFAERVEREQLARYECASCGYLHEDAERHRMVAAGEWRSRLADVAGSRKVALHINSLYSPWSNLSALVEKFLKAKAGGVAKLMEFVTQELGEPFEEVKVSTDHGRLGRKRDAGHPRGVVPAWASVLIASADTQKDGHPFVVRAWGRGYRSRLVDFGHAHDLETLRDLTSRRSYPVEGSAETMRPSYLAIDSGGGIIGEDDSSSTARVYRFALQYSEVCAVKGHGGKRRASRPIRHSLVRYSPPGTKSKAAIKVNLMVLDTHYFKDLVAELINDEADDQWELCEDADDNYLRQMASEHKVPIRRGQQLIEVWKPVSEGAANHFWDAEVYNRAIADMIQCDTLPTREELEQEREAIIEFRRQSTTPPKSRFLRPGRESFITRR